MTTPFENFVNIALGKSVSADVTLPTADKIPVFTGIGRQVTGKTATELGLALTGDLGTAASADAGDFDPAGSASTAQSNAESYADSLITSVYKVQGSYNPQTTGNFPTSANTVGSIPIKQAFIWVVSGVSGQYTFQGVTVNNGDTIVALINNPSATTSADWHITEANLGYTPENQNNKVQNLSTPSATNYPSVDAVLAGLGAKENTLANVITAGSYGSATQVPVITFNAKGIATTVNLATIAAPVLTEANFSVAKTGQPTYTVTWILTALTAARAWTIPDKAINFGDLPSVATTNSNVLSGTRTHIVGGSSNTVSGTGNVVVGGNNNSVSGTNAQVVVNTTGLSGNTFTQKSILLGASNKVVGIDSQHSAALGGITCLYKNITAAGGTEDITADGDIAAAANTLKAMLNSTASGGSAHDIDFIVSIGNDSIGFGFMQVEYTLFATRRVVIAKAQGGAMLSTVLTVGTDTTLGNAATGTLSVSVFVDTANNRIVPRVTTTAGLLQDRVECSVRVTSHYNRK